MTARGSRPWFDAAAADGENAVVTAAALEHLDREIGRTADRLRLLGARWAGRAQGPPSDVVARIRAALDAWADEAARVEGRHHGPVPDLGPRVLADQLVVLVDDLARVCAPERLAPLADELTALRRDLP